MEVDKLYNYFIIGSFVLFFILIYSRFSSFLCVFSLESQFFWLLHYGADHADADPSGIESLFESDADPYTGVDYG